MSTPDRVAGLWSKLPVWLWAIIVGILIGMIAANVWPLLLLNLGSPLAAVAELIFLALYRVGERRRAAPQPASRPRLGIP